MKEETPSERLSDSLDMPFDVLYNYRLWLT